MGSGLVHPRTSGLKMNILVKDSRHKAGLGMHKHFDRLTQEC